MTSDDDEKGGYGKPPKKNQFKKGASGNPKGRPKGSKSFRTLLLDGMDRPVLVTKGNAQKSMPFRRALVDKILKDAFEGDRHARAELIKYEDQGRAELERQKAKSRKKIVDDDIQLEKEIISFMPVELLSVLSLASKVRAVIAENIVELRRLRALEK